MSCYLLKYIDSQISIYEYEDEEFIALKNKGEESWKYQDLSFWDWFKSKIGYGDERLSFIIISDNDFIIDNSINISSQHHLSIDDITDIIGEHSDNNLKVKTFPNIDVNLKILPKKVEPVVSPIKSTKNIDNKKSPLQRYFKKQTSQYKKN